MFPVLVCAPARPARSPRPCISTLVSALLLAPALSAQDPSRVAPHMRPAAHASVYASFAVVGWGSDTCGSIRIPSSFNSLFGLRSTQGMVSRDGIVPLSRWVDILWSQRVALTASPRAARANR